MRPLTLSLLALVACADTTMSVDGYDRSCTTADDCVAVFVGETCGCSCEMEGINAAEAAAYQAAWSDAYAACPADAQLDCGACPDPTLECSGSTCTVVLQLGP